MVCDLEIVITEYLSNAAELLEELERKKVECQRLQADCRTNFEVAENLYPCLERYGIPKTAEFCDAIIPATSDVFEYKLKNKWDCLLSPNNDFASLDEVPDEYVECVGLYFDFKVE